MIQNFDCRGKRMMERIIADRQTIYNRVEFISWRNNTLSLFLAWKSVASTIIVVRLRNNYQKKYRYESKTDYLCKHNYFAWIYSECSCSVVFSKYEYYRNCAWNILGYSAWNILEQYDNWKMVLQRVVAFYTPLGEFHPALSVKDLESTIIVLGNIQLNSAWRNPGSTII